MARIKIEDLPVMEDMKDEELKGIFGGLLSPGLFLPAVRQGGFVAERGEFGQAGLSGTQASKVGVTELWFPTGGTR